MALKYIKVNNINPGDLITSEFMNQIIEEFKTFDTRITELETTSGVDDKKVSIDKLFPTGPIRLGQELQVSGKNFEEPAILNIMSVDGVVIDRFSESSDDTKLVFNIPLTIQSVPKETFLVIRNKYGSDSEPLTLLPRQEIPEGQLVFSDKSGELGIINIGGNYTFSFELDSQTTIAETYRLDPIYTNVTGSNSASWYQNTKLVDQYGANLSSKYVKIEPGNPVIIGINVTIPAGADSVDLALKTTSLNNDAQLTTSSTTIIIKIGSTQPVNDPRVTWVLSDFGPFAKARKIQIGNLTGVEIPYKNFDSIRVEATFLVAGNYSYSALIEPNDGGVWNLADLSPASTPEVAGGGQTISVKVTLNMDPPTSADHPEARFLKIKATRTDNDTIGTFESWIRFPIQGYKKP